MGHSDPTVTLKRDAGPWHEELNVSKVTTFLSERFGGGR
jgi:hypothetical protein